MILYNELEEYPARWLESLMASGDIPRGYVIQGDLRDIPTDSLQRVTQYHTFAGIGGWPLALRMAGYPADAPVWTGSCPCQPFSSAVRGEPKGTKDERHLWPAWLEQITECRPPIIFGEQVASPAGRAWLATVQTDLEALGYLCAGADLCAASVGAPHRRQRIFWGARLADSTAHRRTRGLIPSQGLKGRQQGASAEAPGRGQVNGTGVAHSHCGRPQQTILRGGQPQDIRRRTDVHTLGGWGAVPWHNAEWAFCRDTKIRPIEPGALPVAYGVPKRVDKIKGYGNAIVPQVAAAFIQAFMETI